MLQFTKLLNPQRANFLKNFYYSTFNIVGIESSCDDCGISVLNSQGEVLANSLITHSELVKKFGGVYPHEMAKAHNEVIESLLRSTLDTCSKVPLHAVAVTMGPGLAPCLRAGIRQAEKLSNELQIPLLPIHHLEGHLLTARLFDPNIQFPFLSLLISGGHCMIILATSYRQYKILGTTRDDSIGESFDKVARLLNLDIEKGGGAELEKHASLLSTSEPNIEFNIPLIGDKTFDFSFSGIKAQVLRKVRFLEQPNTNLTGKELDSLVSEKNGAMGTTLPVETTIQIAAAFQEAAFKHLLKRTEAAIKYCKTLFPEVKSLVVSGGVASNQKLRTKLSQMTQRNGYELYCPPIKYCTDNGIMIAWAAHEFIRHNNEELKQSFTANVRNSARCNWSLESLKPNEMN